MYVDVILCMLMQTECIKGTRCVETSTAGKGLADAETGCQF